MKHYFIVILITLGALYGQTAQTLSSKYKTSQKCQTCHLHIIKDWRNSWHAKSHYNKNEYFKKSIDFIAKRTHQGLGKVNVTCAKCHNPRISVTKVSDDYEAIEALGLSKGTKVDKALKDEAISEGINCLVCHNVNYVKDRAPSNVRGMDRIIWNQNGLMSGPFINAKSPYHKTQQRIFFKQNPNKLCFVCHANDHSYVDKSLQFTNMQAQYKGNQRCTECHMGKEIDKYASSFRFNGKVIKRKIRYHTFDGAHVEQKWIGALNLSLAKSDQDVIIAIQNPQPHNIPTGFGGRELLLEIEYLNGFNEHIATKTISLTTNYKRKGGKEAIPHLAISMTKDTSIPAKGLKRFRITPTVNTKDVKVSLYYKLVNSEIHNILKLKEPIWSRKFFIASKTIKLDN